ncbi:salivary gland 16 kD protein, putative [Ixodes scapularis]|uniref:Salivary gland 16 kD protein, putative n=1 Tax=Ixodes scapularis TaxID=6945 RepID=B7QJ90_IXOSC|nr:salivary gland 16 kD protein, putative [Ixodes scapularis]|eukprot:XP_002415247.1 salivary gland 16 kD protein, putative [Ixodes scapularis]
MFKLKFFILFALAVLCFGKNMSFCLVSKSKYKHKGNSESPRATPSQEPKNRDKPSGVFAFQTITSDHLPDFIGTEKDKVFYLDKLLSVCNKEHPVYKINKANITFEKCTFACLREDMTASSKEERIPTGLLCNSGGGKCPDEGPCPNLPLPSN